MAEHFEITTQPDKKLLHIVLKGFFDPQDMPAFAAALIRGQDSLNCGPNQHITLCDISASSIQSQENVAGFERLLADPRLMSRRMAIVIGPSPARMQIRRILRRDHADCFDTRAEAMAWLLQDSPAA